MKLYDYFRSSAAYRVRIALNLKGVAPERAFVHLRRGAQRADDYLALNPQGLVPDARHRRRASVLTQSLAIIEWLDETYPEPPLLPSTAAERARVRALALAIACDIHPLNNTRVLALPDRHARRDRRAEGRLVPLLVRRRVRGARDAARARARDRSVLPRRRADARRHLPRSAARERAPRRPRSRAVPDAAAHRGRVPRAARVRGRGARDNSRTPSDKHRSPTSRRPTMRPSRHSRTTWDDAHAVMPGRRAPVAERAFPSATSIASAATTPSTRRRWAATRRRSRRSSSPSRPTPSCRSCRPRSGASATRSRRRTSTTRSSWSSRSARAA